MHEFEEVKCQHCGVECLAINLGECLICDSFNSACANCTTEHRKAHSDDQVEAFRRELLDEPLTIRERANEELKAQLRKHTETVCDILDQRERLIKKYEKQCSQLANEVDRLRPVS